MCKNSWDGHNRNLSISVCLNNCSPGALHFTSHLTGHRIRISADNHPSPCLIGKKSKLRSSPRYSASFTVRSGVYSKASATIVHSGSFHIIALYAPPFLFTLADPSKLATSRFSFTPTVGGGMLIVCLGCFLGVIAINTSSTSSRGVILAASMPSISSSPFSDRLISNVQFDSKAAHLPNVPLRPEDC